MKMRTTKPNNNPYYITTDDGGFSRCIKGKPTDKNANVLANCVGYANGRFAEIIGEKKENNKSNKRIYAATTEDLFFLKRIIQSAK